jgi:hypothetical protein
MFPSFLALKGQVFIDEPLVYQSPISLGQHLLSSQKDDRSPAGTKTGRFVSCCPMTRRFLLRRWGEEARIENGQHLGW